MKLLYIDHAGHKTTKSTDFLVELLSNFYDVEVVYLELEEIKYSDIVLKYHVDVVVLFQFDFLAPVFIAQGIKTVIVPMYDGSELMPDLHWLGMRQGGCLNFSRRLHERIRRLGTPSKLLRYFPAPAENVDLPSFDELRIFLWQRRPEQGINLRLIETLFGDKASAIHIHDVADDRDLDTTPYLKPTLDSYTLTTSNWFKKRSDYNAVLESCNVFVAPRLTEGIGQAFVEAMGRGMLVLAADMPTHDEYIANWINGVLFNINISGSADFGRAAEIAYMGRQGAIEGHEKWLASRVEIPIFIQSIATPERIDCVDIENLAKGIVRSYRSGLGAYASYLLMNSASIAKISGIELAGRLSKTGVYLTDLPSSSTSTEQAPWLPQNRFLFKNGLTSSYVSDGQTTMRDGICWILNQHLELSFKLDFALGPIVAIKLECCSPKSESEELMVCLSLNGWTLAFLRISGVFETTVPVPPQAVNRENKLRFQANSMTGDAAHHECVSLGLKVCAFI